MITEAILITNDWLFRSSLLLIVAVVLNVTFRERLSAASRHVLWVSGFLWILLVPLVNVVATHFDSRIYVPVSVELGESPGALAADVPSSSLDGETPYSPELNHNTVLGGVWDWRATMRIIWLGVGAMLLLKLLVECLLTRLLYLRCVKGRPEDYALLETCKTKSACRSHIRIAVSSHIDIPFTTGWIRPVIFLPEDFQHLDVRKQQFILLHEVAHIRRYDGLSSLFGELACALFWFNPLTWYAVRQSKLDMEKACDDRVIGITSQKFDYASTMLDVLEVSRCKTLKMRNQLAVASKNQLRSRMASILDDQTNRKAIGRWAWPGFATLTLCVLVPLASLEMGIRNGEDPSVELNTYLEQLESGTDEERKYAAWAVGTAESRHSTSALIKQLDHSNPEVRSVALWALGELKVRKTLPYLLKMTKDEQPLVREMAAKAIGELEDPKGIRSLRRLMEDASSGVRVAAVWALGEVKNKRSLPIVRKALFDESPEVQKMALKVLSRTRYLRAIPDMASLLEDTRAELRLEAVVALDQMHSANAAAFLERALRDEAPTVRAQAVKGLGRLGDKTYVIPLMPLLQDPSIQVREMTVWALDELQL